MRRTFYILSRALLWVFLTVYIALALANYSLVQSLAGAWAGKVLSERSGGVVRVGSIGVNVLDHAVLRDVLLVDPTGDTVSYAERVAVRFNKFPWRDSQLSFSYVSIRNGGFHLVSSRGEGISLKYLLRLFAPEQPRPKHEPQPFTLNIGTVVMRNLRYHHDLPGRDLGYEHGAKYQHLDFSRVDGRVTSLCVDERGRVTCKLHHLQCHEVAGMNVRHIEGDVDVGPQGIIANNFVLTTDSSHLEADVQLRFSDWKTTRHWCDSVQMYVLLKPGTELSMATAAYWAPTLWGMDTRAAVSGTVIGPVADMHISNLSIRFGRATAAMVDGTVSGLPDIHRTRFDITLKRLATNHADLSAVRHPDRMPPVEVLPLLRQLGAIEANATFEGFIHDFHAQAHANTAAGALSARLDMRRHGSTYAYHAEASSPQLRADALLPLPHPSSTGLHLQADGTGLNPRQMSATLLARLHNTTLGDTRLAETHLQASLNHGIADLSLGIDDSLLALHLLASANYTTRQPFLRLDARLPHADLAALGLGPGPDTLLRLSTALTAQAQLDLDDPDPLESLSADLRLDSTSLRRNRLQATLPPAQLTARRRASHRKNIHLDCSIADLDINGYFPYRHLPLLAQRLCDAYLPLSLNPFPPAEPDYTPLADAELTLRLLWHDSLAASRILAPSLDIAPGARLDLNYSFGRPLRMVARADSLRLGNIALHDLRMTGDDLSGRFLVGATADALVFGGASLLRQVDLQLVTSPLRSSCELQWDNNDPDTTTGDICLILNTSRDTSRLTIARNHIRVHGTLWHLGADQDLLFGHHRLLIDNLHLSSHQQALSLNASILHQEDDRLSAQFRNFNLAQANFLLAPSGFSLAGDMGGHLLITHPTTTPLLDADLAISELIVNDQPLGDASLSATWQADSSRLQISASTSLATEAGTHAPLSAQGFIGMGQPDAPLHLDIDFARFSLQTLAPLASAFASQIDGTLQGHLSLDGTASRPQLTGGLRIKEGLLHVDMLGLPFSIDDTLTLLPDRLMLDNLAIRDPQGNALLLSGAVRHHHFRDITLDLGLHTDRLWAMNTSSDQGGDFYGSIFVSADGRLSGPLNQLDISVDANTHPGSRIFFPLSNHRQVKNMGFIRFGDEEEWARGERSATSATAVAQQAGNAYHIAVNLHVTPDVAVAIPVDFSPLRADIAATGQGDLRLTLVPSQPLSLLGTYEIGSGNMDLSVTSIYNKAFSIEQGSTIDFRGAISDAVFDIDAIYALRVNLASLTGVASSSDHTSQTISVHDVITINGTLSNPAIGFDIRLPNADQSVEEEVFSYIDRSNDRDMLNQSVSLLVTGQFYNSTTSNTTSIENSGFAVLANALGSVVSGMVSAVDINFDYTAATELTRQKFDVDINKDFGRLYLESTLGIGEGSNIEGTANQGQITGDVLLGYKARPNVHFFVFHRSNTNDYTRSNMPYKTGAGIKLTKDFDSFGELWSPRRKKGGKR